MAVLIDPPAWPAHGRLWSHLVSDTSLEELHGFAEAVGIPRRGFEGDHYDIPEERYASCLAAGATPVGPRELLARLRASGLRMAKRRGDRGVARMLGVRFADGTSADIDLFLAARPAPPARVFAAMVFLADVAGDLAVVRSVRRAAWGAPGGWREGTESVADNALREVLEETGLVLSANDLRPVGYERFQRRVAAGAGEPLGLWREGQDLLQAYAARLTSRRPPLTTSLADTSDRRWVTPEEFEALCRDEFWWPLAARVLDGLPGAAVGPGDPDLSHSSGGSSG